MKAILKKRLFVMLAGGAMGLANIIPGISGGTLALLLGVYDQFIAALSALASSSAAFFKMLVLWNTESRRSFTQSLKAIPWIWLILLFSGILLAIVFGSGIITKALLRYPAQTLGFFFGLIAASISVPWRLIGSKGWKEYLLLAAGFLLLFLLGGVKTAKPGLASAAADISLLTMLYVFLACAVSSAAMILPGLSGSFLLLLFGAYSYVFGAFAVLFTEPLSAIPAIALYAVAVMLGLLGFSRILNFLLERYHGLVMAFLTGLVAGGLRAIYPFLDTKNAVVGQSAESIPKLYFWQLPPEFDLSAYFQSLEFVSILVCVVCGVFLVLFMQHTAKGGRFHG